MYLELGKEALFGPRTTLEIRFLWQCPGSVRAGECLFVLYVEQEEVMGPVSVWPSSVDPDCPQPALGPARPATRAAVPVRGVMTLTVSLTDSGWWWCGGGRHSWCRPAQTGLMTPLVGTRGGDTRVGARHPRPAPPPATGAKYRERVRRGATAGYNGSHMDNTRAAHRSAYTIHCLAVTELGAAKSW